MAKKKCKCSWMEIHYAGTYECGFCGALRSYNDPKWRLPVYLHDKDRWETEKEAAKRVKGYGTSYRSQEAA